MPTGNNIGNVLMAAIRSAGYSMQFIAAMTNELENGFQTNQPFDTAKLRRFAAGQYGYWVLSPETKVDYAVHLDGKTLTANVVRGILLGTPQFDIPKEHRPGVILTQVRKCIHVKLAI